MSAWQRIRADLVERRAWLLVVVLVAAVAAVPLLMRHEPADPPSPAAAAPLDGPSADATLAAAASALHSDDRSTAKGKARDPFAPPPAPPRPRRSREDAAPEASSSSSPSSVSSSSSSSSSYTPSSSSTYTPPPTPSTSPASPPTISRPTEPAATYELLRADVRFDDEVVRDAVRLQPMPGARHPIALYMGPLSGGRGAAFLIAGAEVEGDGRCRPRLRLCSHLVLRPGEKTTLTIDDEPHTLELLRIRTEQTTSRAKAERFYTRESAHGRCALDVYDYLGFDVESGTVAPHHDNRGTCEYPGLDRKTAPETARMVGTR